MYAICGSRVQVYCQEFIFIYSKCKFKAKTLNPMSRHHLENIGASLKSPTESAVIKLEQVKFLSRFHIHFSLHSHGSPFTLIQETLTMWRIRKQELRSFPDFTAKWVLKVLHVLPMYMINIIILTGGHGWNTWGLSRDMYVKQRSQVWQNVKKFCLQQRYGKRGSTVHAL